MFKTPRSQRRKSNISSTPPVVASIPVPIPSPTPTTKRSSTSGPAKRTRSSQKRPISFVNGPNVHNMIAGINESFESAQTSTQMDTDNNNDDLLSCVDDDDLSV